MKLHLRAKCRVSTRNVLAACKAQVPKAPAVVCGRLHANLDSGRAAGAEQSPTGVRHESAAQLTLPGLEAKEEGKAAIERTGGWSSSESIPGREKAIEMGQPIVTRLVAQYVPLQPVTMEHGGVVGSGVGAGRRAAESGQISAGEERAVRTMKLSTEIRRSQDL